VLVTTHAAPSAETPQLLASGALSFYVICSYKLEWPETKKRSQVSKTPVNVIWFVKISTVQISAIFASILNLWRNLASSYLNLLLSLVQNSVGIAGIVHLTNVRISIIVKLRTHTHILYTANLYGTELNAVAVASSCICRFILTCVGLCVVTGIDAWNASVSTCVRSVSLLDRRQRVTNWRIQCRNTAARSVFVYTILSSRRDTVFVHS